MKKLIVVVGQVLMIALMAAPLGAQRVATGLKAGANFATLTGDAPDDLEVSGRFVGGGFLLVRLTHAVSFMPELLYSQKGAQSEFQTASEKLRVDYIDLPLLFRFAPPSEETDHVVPFAMVGPAVAFKVNCTVKGESTSGEESVTCGDAWTGSANTVDFGVVAGLGTDLTVRGGAITFDARYAYGLSRVFDFDNGDAWHHSVVSVMLGYRFERRPEQVAQIR